MLIENQYIEIPWSAKNCKYYESLGYTLSKNHLNKIKLEDLSKKSSISIKVKCDSDNCDKIFTRPYYKHINEGHDFCLSCAQKRGLKKYYKETGYKSPNQNPIVKEKKKQNYFNKTGYDNPSRNPEVKKKKDETYFLHTGYKKVGTSPEDRAKAQKTYFEKTGYLNPMQDPKNAGRKTSKKCEESMQILKNNFKNVSFEVPIFRYSMDCLLDINNCKIDIEYDGWWFHKDKTKEDDTRNQKIINEGIKVYRIKSGTMIPEEKHLIQDIIDFSKSKDMYRENILEDWNKRSKEN